MDSPEDAWVDYKQDVNDYDERDVNYEDECDGFRHFKVAVICDVGKRNAETCKQEDVEFVKKLQRSVVLIFEKLFTANKHQHHDR